MKNYWFLLFIGYCVSFKFENDVDNWSRKIQSSQDFKDDGIEYPCHTNDMNCIRKFFATHGRCKPTYGPIPDPFIMKQMILPMTTSNISFTVDNAKIRGFNGHVTSFYINKKTDNLVIAFELKPLTVSSPSANFRYNRKGKEPILLSDAFYVIYSSVTFTSVIPHISNLQLSRADSYAYLDDNDPTYGFAPGVMKSFDPVVLRGFSDLLSKIPENGKESLIILAPNFVNIFIQNKICDFGISEANK